MNNVSTQKEIYELIRQNYLIKKKKYLNNMIPFIDWQQANNNFNKVKTKLLQAKYTFLLKQEIYNRLYKTYEKIY